MLCDGEISTSLSKNPGPCISIYTAKEKGSPVICMPTIRWKRATGHQAAGGFKPPPPLDCLSPPTGGSSTVPHDLPVRCRPLPGKQRASTTAPNNTSTTTSLPTFPLNFEGASALSTADLLTGFGARRKISTSLSLFFVLLYVPPFDSPFPPHAEGSRHYCWVRAEVKERRESRGTCVCVCVYTSTEEEKVFPTLSPQRRHFFI